MKKILLSVFLLIAMAIGAFYFLTAPIVTTLGESDAIRLAIAKYPELAVYQTTDLPPSSIETKAADTGWYVGFVTRGSGLPGILSAKCYYVDNAKSITVAGEYQASGTPAVEELNLQTCTPLTPPSDETSLPPVNEEPQSIAIGQSKKFGDISIRPVSVEEDSRCPVDVTCIQAGTVRITIEVTANEKTASSIVKLGQEFTTENVRITLTDVTPAKHSTSSIQIADYRFTFTVTPQSEPVATNPNGACYRGGCSGQLCSDQKDMASTCEYRPEYACYKDAVCERQASGQCGWTQTTALNACLASSGT